ncbi:N-acetylneuraminate synthase family protein [Aliarcobacter butzleri]|uniref:N-acetylneuraminate synthase family protein n=1 Tax=Aliarcobacter butzleri TaxID=28197 RepID=UPI00263D2EA0|nr:N-acetylneuraminate synthase family protein [Aliarcobacter butzleri]MDN5048470.1 N-acetylneuraminate synthase family protein [Aliarcobacter butzleri]
MIIQELNKPYIIAEIGCNHNGNTELGLKMIKAAKDCGADAVKFQYFTKDNLFTDDYLSELDSGNIKLENVDKWEDKELGLTNIREQISAFTNDEKQLIVFKNYCSEIGIDFGCTPVNQAGVNFLAKIKSDYVKISSMDANNLEMIDACIEAKLLVIISTGMATLQDIDKIYNLFRERNYTNFSILHCVSIYPPRDEIVNLNFIDTLKGIYDCDIGYSDHSLGFSLPIAAIAKGCKIIEKHFTLDKNMPGWDHKVSADENDLRIICEEGNKVFRSLGSKYKILSEDEIEKRKKFRRSMVAKHDLEKGHILTKEDFVYKRPGTGISPDEAMFFIGKKLTKDVKIDKTIFESDFI